MRLALCGADTRATHTMLLTPLRGAWGSCSTGANPSCITNAYVDLHAYAVWSLHAYAVWSLALWSEHACTGDLHGVATGAGGHAA